MDTSWTFGRNFVDVQARELTMSDCEDSSNEEAAADKKPAGYGKRFWRWISEGERKKVQRLRGKPFTTGG